MSLKGLHPSVLVAAGYGLSLSYSGLVQSSPVTPFAPESAFTSMLSAAFQVGFLGTYFVVALVAYMALLSSLGPRSISKFVTCGALSFSGAGALVSLGALALPGHAEVTLVSRLFLGVGCTLIFCSWLTILSQRAMRTAILELLAGSLGAAACTGLIQMLLPLGYIGPAQITLLVLALPLLAVTQKRIGEEPTVPRSEEDADPHSESVKELLASLRLPILCGSLLVSAGPLMASAYINSAYSPGDLALAATVAHLAAVVVLFFLLIMLQRQTSLPQTFVFIFPILATSILLLCFAGTQWGMIFLTMSYCAYNLTSLLIIVTSFRVSRDYGAPAVFPYSIMSGVVCTASTLGAWAGTFLNGAFLESGALSMVSLAVLYAMSIIALMASRSKSKTSPTTEDPFTRKCTIIANDYGLTPRETEVLEHLARGKSIPATATAMLLSKDTIKSHVKGIYAKLDIHKRQELITLVESFQPTEE